MSQEMSRRRFLQGLGVMGGAALLGCRPEAPATPTAAPTAAAATSAEVPFTAATSTSIPLVETAIPTAEPVDSATNLEVNSAFPEATLKGFPELVDRNHVLLANEPRHGNFTNVTGLGSEMMFAEPGVLLVGPDFPKHQVDAANKAIAYKDSTNHFPLANNDSEDIPLPEGRLVWISAGHVDFNFGDMNISLPHKKGHNWWLFMRSPFTDELKDTETSTHGVATGYAPRKANVEIFPAGSFISENAIMRQALDIVHNDNNCGLEGCTKVSMVVVDFNTRAYSILRHGDEGSWQLSETNLGK